MAELQVKPAVLSCVVLLLNMFLSGNAGVFDCPIASYISIYNM